MPRSNAGASSFDRQARSRRSLKTTDRKLAERRLTDLRQRVDRLTGSEDSNVTFDEVATRWVNLTAGEPSSVGLGERPAANADTARSPS